MQPPIIDVDDRATWPDDVAALSDSLADLHRNSTSCCSDLRLGDDVDGRYRGLLGPATLRAYHCTRLLAHEVESIRNGGLRVLTADLVAARIEHARDAGFITQQEATEWKQCSAFADGDAGNREDLVCLSLSRTTFGLPAAVEDLLSLWGGEAMYSSVGGAKIRTRLERLGTPAVVVARVPVEHSTFYPAISKVFVGAALGFDELGADVMHRAGIAAMNIEAVLTPADARYLQLGALPIT